VLAYVFWHRPRPEVEIDGYEEAQRRFHARLEVESACFRLDRLPFDDAPGYEDWYLIEDWQAVGKLNETAVDAQHKGDHDRAAAMVDEGWGGIYACVQGPAVVPDQAHWLHKPRGRSNGDFLARVEEGASAWQRQMVLGPAPELCVANQGGAQAPYRRERL